MKLTAGNLKTIKRLLCNAVDEICWSNEESGLSLELSYSKTAGGYMAFKAYFNGAFVSINKTFPATWKKAHALITAHALTLEETPILIATLESQMK